MAKVKDLDKLKVLNVFDNGFQYMNLRTKEKPILMTNEKPPLRKGTVLVVDMWTDRVILRRLSDRKAVLEIKR
jgi:hypothetical protein